MSRISPKAPVRCTSAACGWSGRRATSRTEWITFHGDGAAKVAIPADIGYPCPRCGAAVAAVDKDGNR